MISRWFGVAPAADRVETYSRARALAPGPAVRTPPGHSAACAPNVMMVRGDVVVIWTAPLPCTPLLNGRTECTKAGRLRRVRFSAHTPDSSKPQQLNARGAPYADDSLDELEHPELR